MEATAVIVQEPKRLTLGRLPLAPMGDGDVIVDIEHSGISTGTERLLCSGRMPHFPGMGYPLVPGYESVGRVAESTVDSLSPWRSRLRAGCQLLRRGARALRWGRVEAWWFPHHESAKSRRKSR